MPASNTRKTLKKDRSKANARLEILFCGPLLHIPTAEQGKVTGVEVFVPRNGHPMGAIFLPSVWFSPEELEGSGCKNWPEPSSFSLLDPHGYSIEITQDSSIKKKPFYLQQIPSTNLKVNPGRHMRADWEIAIAVRGRISAWTSHRLTPVKEGIYVGMDAPTSGFTAALQKLTYENVTMADCYGASANARAYLQENAVKGGSLIIVGEVPYQPSLLHERRAVDALARLASLDLHLADTAPATTRSQLMDHVTNCGLSVILAPQSTPTMPKR